jgi:sulfonate transport system substrate-binding protein
MSLTRRRLLAASLAAAPLAAGLAAIPSTRRALAQDDAKPDVIKLDYAYYNPSSLALRRFGWLEEDLAADEVAVEWTLSAGSNKANEFLRAEAVDFGSTAGAAALLAKANGAEIETVYVYSKPEWTALVVPADSTIADVPALAGKKVAATKGTDPYFFLLRSLSQAGLSGADVEIVNLQHADGRLALERGQVDAWAGLDPHMAASEIEAGSRLLYRNIDFNTYGFLNAREAFTAAYPAHTSRVLAAYERARVWIIENPEEAAQILAEEAKISTEIAQRELFERTVLTGSPVPGPEHAAVLEQVIPIFEAESQVKPGTDVAAALADLLAPQYAEGVVAPNPA